MSIQAPAESLMKRILPQGTRSNPPTWPQLLDSISHLEKLQKDIVCVKLQEFGDLEFCLKTNFTMTILRKIVTSALDDVLDAAVMIDRVSLLVHTAYTDLKSALYPSINAKHELHKQLKALRAIIPSRSTFKSNFEWIKAVYLFVKNMNDLSLFFPALIYGVPEKLKLPIVAVKNSLNKNTSYAIEDVFCQLIPVLDEQYSATTYASRLANLTPRKGQSVNDFLTQFQLINHLVPPAACEPQARLQMLLKHFEQNLHNQIRLVASGSIDGAADYIRHTLKNPNGKMKIPIGNIKNEDIVIVARGSSRRATVRKAKGIRKPKRRLHMI